MKWGVLALVLASCTTSDLNFAPPAPMAVTVETSAYDVNVENGLTLFVSTSGTNLSARSLRDRITIVTSPTKNHLTDQDLAHKLPISIKTTDTKSRYAISSKGPFSLGKTYGVYLGTEPNAASLVYVFRATAPPKLIAHDLGDGASFAISSRRTRMTFTFDQPINVTDDHAVLITSLAPNLPPPRIERLTLDLNRTTLTVNLKRDGPPWVVQEHYQIVLGKALMNDAHLAIVERPINVQVIAESTPFSLNKPTVLGIFSHSVEFVWAANQTHATEIYLWPVDNEAAIKIHGAKVSSKPAAQTDEQHFIGRLAITELASHTAYNYLIRHEDNRSEIMLGRGSFSTADEISLEISEIMIDPETKALARQQAGEYLEIANRSDKPIHLDRLVVRFEDPRTGAFADCPVDGDVFVAGHGFMLIAFSEFQPNLYGLDASTPVYHVVRKAECGGLANRHAKIIKIHGDDGYFIDRYGGHGWPGKKGLAIVRKAWGLDDAQNYCYSLPTPGIKNNSCG